MKELRALQKGSCCCRPQLSSALSAKLARNVNDAELMMTLMARAEQEQLMTNRGQYLTQQNENEMVKQELALLSPDAVVYKLVGPALIKQDLAEAKQNVDKRILFITTEMYVRLAATATCGVLTLGACVWMAQQAYRDTKRRDREASRAQARSGSFKQASDEIDMAAV